MESDRPGRTGRATPGVALAAGPALLQAGTTTASTVGTASQWRVGVGAILAVGVVAGGILLRRWLRRRGT